METQIYLVRHGQIELKNEKTYIGQLDLPLSPEGMKQAQTLQEQFKQISLDCAYTSPLCRCVATLDILLGERSIPRFTIEALQEINMGDWDGKSFAEIEEHYPGSYEQRGRELDVFAPPAGESFVALQKRVLPAFAEMVKENDTRSIVILAHAGVIRVILANLFGLTIKEVFKWKIPYAASFKLCYNQKSGKWICQNQ
ncbi:histidine phosphatase family protein [Acetobacterium sp. UBA5834]|jgi:probable phosphoglycerate mutase|uniref:histidine phosphatase family protein n=1 Tax=Acetobacterium sp. UBA5834 TaxID=1945907 RepID=UPI00257E7AD0|nr:histidine phosphatase family protein [Acetobacterium sp. UBA5834]